MKKKVIIAAVFCIILLVSGGMYATEVASKIPADTKAIKEIVKEVDKLASNDIPASTVFAKELVKVLSKYQVSFSDKLTELKLASLPIPEPNESQLEQLYETSNKISSICRDSTWIKDPNRAVPVSLRNDLLVTMVNHCPHSLARLEAARWLAERTFPNDEKPEYKSDVPYKLADAACMSAINHVLSIPPKDDAVYFMSLVFGASLTLNHVMLAELIGEQTEKEEVDKILSDFNSRIKALREITSEKDSISKLDQFDESMSNIEKQIELIEQMASEKQELITVVKGFLDAISKEDKEKVRQFVTESIGELLDKSESLQKDLLQLSNIKEIKLQSMSLLSGSSGNKERTIISFPITVLVTKEDGTQIEKTLKSVTAVKTSQGWLIGSE